MPMVSQAKLVLRKRAVAAVMKNFMVDVGGCLSLGNELERENCLQARIKY